MTALVTGGAGFIGSHLCDRLLAEGARVVAVDDLSTGRTANLEAAMSHGSAFALHQLDIRSGELRELVADVHPDVVFHLAAQSGVRPSLRDPGLDASINIVGTIALLEAAAAAGVRKIVYAASGGTMYGEASAIPISEDERWSGRPTSPYGISKRTALDYLELYRAGRGLDFTALALANVYGPRQDPHGEAGVISIFASQMLAGEQPAIHGTGRQTRDYVYIDDAAQAFMLALGETGAGELLNIGTGIETSVARIYELLASIVGFAPEPRFEPSADAGPERSALLIDAAAAKLDWRPRTSLEVGLAETVSFLRSRGRSTGS